MLNVCHILDSACGWEQRVALGQLVDRMPGDQVAHCAASLGPLGPTTRRAMPIRVDPLPTLRSAPGLSAPFVARWVGRHGGQLVHAWSVDALSASATAGEDRAVVLSLFDPREARARARLVRTLARGRRLAVACSCQIVRRRLIEGGVPPPQCVVIRPGVDFAAINRWKRASRRAQLGIAPHETMIVLPEPVAPTGGQFDGFFAISLLAQLGARIRAVVPGDTPEAERIGRFSAGLVERRSLVRPDPAIPFEELVASADALLLAPRGDCSTTAIAWAMASNALVIGTAVYSVAELISHKVNGLLFKQTPGRSMLPALARLIAGAFPFEPPGCRATLMNEWPDDRGNRTAEAGKIELSTCSEFGHGLRRRSETARSDEPGGSPLNWERIEIDRLKQAAHGQAYEVFGLRRCVEQHLQLYRNLASGAAPGEGIGDSAMAG